MIWKMTDHSVSEKHTFLKLPEVQQITGLSRSGIYQKVQDGIFPPPIKIGERATAWIEKEVRQWMQDIIDDNRG